MRYFYFGALFFLLSCNNCEDQYLDDKSKYLFAVVDTAYKDHQNRGIPTIGLQIIKSDLKIYKGLDGRKLYGLYLNAMRGDTIIKEANSLEYKLIKTDTTMSFYPICEGREIR